jgi:hypothetical protein
MWEHRNNAQHATDQRNQQSIHQALMEQVAAQHEIGARYLLPQDTYLLQKPLTAFTHRTKEQLHKWLDSIQLARTSYNKHLLQQASNLRKQQQFMGQWQRTQTLQTTLITQQNATDDRQTSTTDTEHNTANDAPLQHLPQQNTRTHFRHTHHPTQRKQRKRMREYCTPLPPRKHLALSQTE